MSDKTKQSEGTPGPWIVLGRGGGFSIRTGYKNAESNGIAIIPWMMVGHNRKEAEANALIISTAPDGVELAKMVRMECEMYHDDGCRQITCVKASAILARVDGTNV